MKPLADEGARLLVFAKAPEPGIAKTRLIPLLGAEGAACLQARLTRRTVATAQATGLGRVELWCAPDTGHPFFAALAAESGIVLRTQLGADLGERMLHAATESLACARYAMILGTDCPLLAWTHFRRVLDELRWGREAVIVPAEDGGYVLLGLARAAPELFRDIDWGTDRVLAQTRARLEKLDFRFSELDPLPDLDRPEDCLKLSRERPRFWHDLTIEESTP
ncbi:MAG TPA: TIGR04282 family arsenosugar biosynthesis glycosyltransferase [Methylococcaceae bacterium]|nr:TIGR04282 family arsenosugar biosynthesis glycosyltransferase [Methylococcaceae bacterium]